MTNRNVWNAVEDKVLKASMESATNVKKGAELASTRLNRSYQACYGRWLYVNGKHPANAKLKAKKKLRGKLIERGVKVWGNKVYITPTEGIQVIFCNS